MKNRALAPVYVGIFTLVGTLLLLFVSLRAQADVHVADPRPLVFDFPHAKSLATGAEVRYLGVKVGIVTKIALVEDGGKPFARVTADIRKDVEIREDAKAMITPSTLLGNEMLSIEAGPGAAPPATADRPIKGEEAAGLNEVLEKLSSGLDEVKNLAGNLDTNQKNVFEKLEAVIDENRENLKTATDELAKVGPKLTETVDKVSEMVGDASDGKGTLGKLLSDSEMYDEIKKITEQLSSGEGTLGKLIFTEEGLTDIKDSLEEMKLAFNDIRDVLDENRTDLKDAVSGLKDVGPAIDKAAKNLEEITEKVNNGEGTIAKAINDPDLYNEAKSAFTQIQQTFEEAEEQTVLQSFLRIFTGAI